MKIIETIQTKNRCYIKETPMTPTGIVVHSTGAVNNTLKRYVDCEAEFGKNQYGNHWNNAEAQTMVHAFIGYDKNNVVNVAHTLPYNYACWGCGNGSKGSYNYNPTGHIQFEICEGTTNDKVYFNAAYTAAVEYAAFLCQKFGLSVNSIVGHYEAHNQGYASNHGDPDSYFKNFGKSMKTFRTDVQKQIEKDKKQMIKKDNTPDNYAKTAIDWAVKNKILFGDDNGNYKLHASVTRQDMLVFLYRALNK